MTSHRIDAAGNSRNPSPLETFGWGVLALPTGIGAAVASGWVGAGTSTGQLGRVVFVAAIVGIGALALRRGLRNLLAYAVGLVLTAGLAFAALFYVVSQLTF